MISANATVFDALALFIERRGIMMRREVALNSNWLFKKGNMDIADQTDHGNWESVVLPHTWNALDGQDGNNDYYRGQGWYYRVLRLEEKHGAEVYLKIGAANKLAKVWCNGRLAGEHRGGFSSFVINLTDLLHTGDNDLTIMVDNSSELAIYPMAADFTFFGGLYRGVELIQFDEDAHFDVERYGVDAVFVTPKMDGNVQVSFEYTGTGAAEVQILDQSGNTVCAMNPVTLTANETQCSVELAVKDIHTWKGTKDPYLYKLVASIYDEADQKLLDRVTVSFGFRDYSVDAEEGFFLNGVGYPLRGVCRHQDREDLGWAITQKEHLEDMSLIREMGANTIRLAHYQQDPFFYDLCDQNGMVVWAEIPFITAYDPREEADENLRSQMKELITQNYNHPSICFWGIANEIGVGGESEKMYSIVRELNQMTKKLDPSRLTTIANVGLTKTDSPLFHITDLTSYNEYMGWYEGKYTEHGSFCDTKHAEIPEIPLAISEYGADCILDWHSENPKVKDYTEEYQALLHEHAERAFSERRYLWATWLWNMFDFAADARDEGGCKGRNNKGLVSYDRKVKKQAFYLYKARWSEDPFVYICGKRFTKHADNPVMVKVYSNQRELELFVNGVSQGTKCAEAIFEFDGVVLADGKNELTVRTASGFEDSVVWEKVSEFPKEYVFKQEKQLSEAVTQWFADLCPQSVERTDEPVAKEGYLSVYDTMEEILKYPEGYQIIQELVSAPLALINPNMGGGQMQGGAMSFYSIWGHINRMLPSNLIYVVNDRLSEIKKM